MSPARNQCKIKRMVSAFAFLCSLQPYTHNFPEKASQHSRYDCEDLSDLHFMHFDASACQLPQDGSGRRGRRRVGGSGCGATAEAVHLKEILCVCLSKFPVGDGTDVRHLAGRTLTEGL